MSASDKGVSPTQSMVYFPHFSFYFSSFLKFYVFLCYVHQYLNFHHDFIFLMECIFYEYKWNHSSVSGLVFWAYISTVPNLLNYFH